MHALQVWIMLLLGGVVFQVNYNSIYIGILVAQNTYPSS